MKLVAVIWSACRREDGSLDLQKVARQTGCKITPEMDMYLSLLEAIHPIKSRQVAALSIASALSLYEARGDKQSDGN